MFFSVTFAVVNCSQLIVKFGVRWLLLCVVTGTCARSGCLRRRAVNQLTGQLHDHCSIDCMRQDQATNEAVSNPTADENGIV